MERARRPKTTGGITAAVALPRTSKHNAITSPLKKSTTAARNPAPRMSSSSMMCPPLATEPTQRRPAIAVTKKTIHLTANIEVQVRPDAALIESNHDRITALAKLSHQQTLQADIDFDGLRPLVDIAYWSTFSEVRRDAAAAFATLSKNAANLEILAQAGGLGAALALLHGAKTHMDLCVLRDASDTLFQLVQLSSIQVKLLNAPNGIASVFALLRVADVHVKRTALRILLQMLSLPDAAAILVKCGGFCLVLHLLRTVATRKDTKLKQLAALLLKRLAAPERNKDVVADEPEIAKMLCQLVQDPYLDTDVAFRRDLLEALVLLAQDRRAARHFVEFNIVPSLLLLLASPPHLFTTSFLVLSLLELFASNPHNLSSLLHDDIIPSVLAAAFHDRPPQAPMSLSTPTASSGMDLTAVRVKALMVFNHVVLLPPDIRQPLVDFGVVELIASEKLHLSTEKRIKRLTVTLLTALACVDTPHQIPMERNAVITDKPFHLDLIARGFLPCLLDLLRDDVATRVDVVTAMWHLCESDCPRLLLCKEPVLEALLAVSIQNDLVLKAKIAKVFADFATKAENTHKLMESRVVLFLVKSIAPSCRSETLRYADAVSVIYEADEEGPPGTKRRGRLWDWQRQPTNKFVTGSYGTVLSASSCVSPSFKIQNAL
ncbi:hypothetical protein, variant 1 [Aphanomyces invadans]|uniref:Armadillo repeat-containing domain-containing protein n=1 Tax=Aphanomyces invadans TaxID=157072 RepID=A0A024UN42_9STRA|nr:hypothetical protein, variant 1 [Aphanomyces invadans]ETW07272.1 hypothetical protein, variant 1 [Aphanomyces invadans]|eukprot:XP_008863366.1 hypothetical protein, variant 1 [Aphanomyces invadans]